MCLQVTTDDGEVKKGEMVVDPLTDPDPKCVAVDSLRQQVSHSMDSWLLRARHSNRYRNKHRRNLLR